MRALQQVLLDGREPMDNLDGRVAAVEAVVPFARVKWAGSLQKTDANGVWVVNIPAGLMKGGLSIIGPVIRGAGNFDCAAAVAGTPQTGYQVTLTFTRRKTTLGVPLPAVVVGAAATTVNVSLNETTTGVVVFDVGFAEPDVVGP